MRYQNLSVKCVIDFWKLFNLVHCTIILKQVWVAVYFFQFTIFYLWLISIYIFLNCLEKSICRKELLFDIKIYFSTCKSQFRFTFSKKQIRSWTQAIYSCRIPDKRSHPPADMIFWHLYPLEFIQWLSYSR